MGGVQRWQAYTASPLSLPCVLSVSRLLSGPAAQHTARLAASPLPALPPTHSILYHSLQYAYAPQERTVVLYSVLAAPVGQLCSRRATQAVWVPADGAQQANTTPTRDRRACELPAARFREVRQGCRHPPNTLCVANFRLGDRRLRTGSSKERIMWDSPGSPCLRAGKDHASKSSQ